MCLSSFQGECPSSAEQRKVAFSPAFKIYGTIQERMEVIAKYFIVN